MTAPAQDPATATAPAPRQTVGDGPPVLRVEDLQVVYRTPVGDVPAVDHVSFSLQPGQRLGLIGESGSGKTTMVTALMRLTRPPGRINGGRVMLGDVDLMQLDGLGTAHDLDRHLDIALVVVRTRQT